MLKIKTYKNAEFLEIKYFKIIKGLEVLLLITHSSEDPEEDHSPRRQARERNPVYQAGT